MKRSRNAFIVLGGLIVVVALGVFFAKRPHASVLAVAETTVSYKHFSTRLPETGVVQRPQTQTLAALVGGNLGTLSVRPGQRVAAGALIATIVNPQLESNAASAREAMASAQAHVRSISETNAALPSQNRSSIVQAQAAVEQARSGVTQARQDAASGAQSGLGYGGSTAEAQRVAANSTLTTAETALREARRINAADQALFDQGAISKDALNQAQARVLDTQVAADQARRNRAITYQQLSRTQPYLADRVRAAENQLQQAEAALAAARANAANSKAGDLQGAQADAAAKANDYQYASDQLARTEIRAPFAGTIQTIASQTGDTLRSMQPGDAVTAGAAIATIAAGDGYVVKTKVDEQDVASIRVGQRATVSGEDLGTHSLRGHVIAISQVAQKSDDVANTSRQVITTVSLDQTVPFLRDGMTVDVDITTLDIARALAIPTDAIRRDDDRKPYVFVVRGGHAKRVPVVTGLSNDVLTIVRRGLRAGDRIVTDKTLAVSDGLAVRPAPTPSSGVKNATS